MLTLVDRPNLQLQVADAARVAVCLSCKGSGRLWKTLFYRSGITAIGGLYWLGEAYECPRCDGRGWWREAEC